MGLSVMFKMWFALTLAATLALAQDTADTLRARGSVSGTVPDGSTGAPMEVVPVSAGDGPKQVNANTDALGHFALRDLLSGLSLPQISILLRPMSLTRFST